MSTLNLGRAGGAALAVVAALAVFSSGCAKDALVNPPDALKARALDASIQPAVNQVVAGANQFALDFYGQLRTQPGNIFCSPQNISTAFAMTCAGASGTTRDEMVRVFHFPQLGDTLHAAWGAVLASLNRGATLGGYELSLANRLWGQQDFTFLQPFLDITRKSYGAELQRLDFLHDPGGSRSTINTWVENQTHGRIQNLMPPDAVTNATRLVLTSAIYFKGLWATQFDARNTVPAPFHVAPGVERNVPTMSAELDCSEGRGTGVGLLELPYRGKDLSMVILLPDSLDGLAGLEDRLDAASLDAWIAGLHATRMRVMLPKFTVTTYVSLVSMLQALGMQAAFVPGDADFSLMDGGRDLFISAAVHKAWVQVNEEGTEAAAATGVSVGVTSVPPGFVVNHPFLFLIRDNVTGSLLFLGRVTDPSS
ncbi:MAG TPA: serpin family protein [Candidatus Saccharimonadales bacterium]|nr:serpin family protein [Candidatus Saccharimonadales bacterium]